MKLVRANCWRRICKQKTVSYALLIAVAWLSISALYESCGFNRLDSKDHKKLKDVHLSYHEPRRDVTESLLAPVQAKQRARNEGILGDMRASVNRSTTNNEETTQTTIRAKGQIRTGTKPVRDKPRLKERPAWMQKHTTGKSVRQLRDNRGKFNTDSDDIRRPTEPSRLSGLAVLPTDSHLEAVVVYMTHPAEIGARQYIRDTIAYTYTMGEYKHVPVAYYFVTGSGYLADRNGGVVKQSSDEGPGRSVRKRFDTQELYDEAEFFKDMIVLDDFEEDYFKLTSKTGATIARIDELLQIANTSARWYVKTDTDACVDHAVLLRTLTKNGARARVGDSAWMGMLYYNVPTRPGGNDSKWDDHTYTPSTYPPYMNGPLYALTWALVDAIASRHRQGDLVMYANEDAAVGVWLNESGIVPTPIEIKFPQWVERKYYITPAVCWDVPLVVHGCWTESDHIYYRSRGFCNRHDRDDGRNTINTTRIGNGEKLRVVLGAKVVQIRPAGGALDGTYNPPFREEKRRKKAADGPKIMSDAERTDKSAECVKQGFNSWHQCRKYLRDTGLL